MGASVSAAATARYVRQLVRLHGIHHITVIPAATASRGHHDAGSTVDEPPERCGVALMLPQRGHPRGELERPLTALSSPRAARAAP